MAVFLMFESVNLKEKYHKELRRAQRGRVLTLRSLGEFQDVPGVVVRWDRSRIFSFLLRRFRLSMSFKKKD